MLVFYMILTGGSSSVKRACIMVIYRIIGKIVYRRTNAIVSVSATMLILLVENPYTIMQTGTLLSFAGTIGLILGLPLLPNKSGKIKNSIFITLVANVLLLPITAYSFCTISLTFLLSNVLASLLMGPIILYGFFILTISYLSIPLTKILAIPLNLLLNVFIQIAQICGKLPFSQIVIARLNFWEIALYYGVIFILYMFLKIKKKQHKRRIEKKFLQYTNKMLLIVCILFVLPYGLKIVPQDLKIYFIDIGQGDSTLIQTPNHKNILIDGGGSENFDVGEKTLLPYLLNRKIKTIDILVISHFDTDHCRTDY